MTNNKTSHRHSAMYAQFKKKLIIIVILISVSINIFCIRKIYQNRNKIYSVFTDWTIIAPPISKNKYVDKTWTISFANDDSKIFRSAQKYLNFSLSWFGFKKIINYTSSDVESFKKANPHIFKYKRGYGLWSWKPYLILETLNKIPEGDILLYIDSGSAVNDDLSEIFNNFDDKNVDLIAFSQDLGKNSTNEIATKKSFLQAMNLDNDEYRNSDQIGANIIIIRNNKNNKLLMQKWLNLCLNEEFISPLRRDEAMKKSIPINKTFKIHLEDQALLQALLYKEGKNIKYLSTKKYIDYKVPGFKSEKSHIIAQSKKKLDVSLLNVIDFENN